VGLGHRKAERLSTRARERERERKRERETERERDGERERERKRESARARAREFMSNEGVKLDTKCLANVTKVESQTTNLKPLPSALPFSILPPYLLSLVIGSQ